MAPSRNRIAYYRDRCTPPLTQRELARALGVHWNTVVNWERDGVPAAADLLRLAELFVTRGAIRDEAAAIQFWTTSGRMPWEPPPELAGMFVVERPPNTRTAHEPLLPFHRNPLFVGRKQQLATLSEYLAASKACAITGMGGIGKTQLVVELVYQVRHMFPGGIFWISFADPDAIAAAIARYGWASHLDLHPHFRELSLPEQVQLVQSAWQLSDKRLLVFDNCEDEALFARWCPATGGSCVLLTSRRTHWNPTLSVASVPLVPFQRAESVQLLQHYLQPGSVDAAALALLAADVGDLPLALHLIGSQLNQAQVEQKAIRKLVSQASLVMRSNPPMTLYSPTAHTPDLSATFASSLDQLDPATSTDVLAQLAIECIACFAHGEFVDRNLVYQALRLLRYDATEPSLHEALMKARNIGLVQDEGATLSMHRLVAEHIWNQGAGHDPIIESVARSTLQYAQHLLEANDFLALLAFYPHLKIVTERVLAINDRLGAELCEVQGAWLTQAGDYSAARASFQRAYEIWQRQATDAELDLARCSNMIGLVFQLAGEFEQAEHLFEYALRLWTEELGPKHLYTATAANNLGYLLFVRGDITRARSYLEQALYTREALLEPFHPELARSYNNLGYVLYRQGDYDTALPLLRHALKLREDRYGDSHPLTAQSLNNLGDLYLSLEDDDLALGYYTRAFNAREHLLGYNHIGTAESLRKLGDLSRRQGNVEHARHCYERALDICQRNVGPTSLDTAWTLTSIAALEQQLGNSSAAYIYFKRVQWIYQQVLLPDHPDRKSIEQILTTLTLNAATQTSSTN